ncbi:MAG TPA: histidine kinase dimerization/phospho-acceptor domain-containing protein, partial [Pirellula sp.]|nr:histidine kinase dimerization/phospho-acceptor domain-containing protein [Pirellula sp.]
MRFTSSLLKLVFAFLLLQAGLTLALILFSRSQNRQMAVVEIDEVLHSSACGLQPSIERLIADTSHDRSEEIERMIRDFGEKAKIRVTVVDPNGRVLADSDVEAETLDNHKQRPEIVQARLGKIGKATRLSETTKTEYYYFAIPLLRQNEPVGFLRLAMATAQTRTRLADISRTFVWFALASAALASTVLIAYAQATISPLRELTHFARAIAKGDYGQRLSSAHWRDEWRLLGKAFDQMQVELQGREDELHTNSDRLSAVLASMHEGIISIDLQRRVLLANRAAAVLLDVPYQELLNRPFYELVRNPLIEECVEEVFQVRGTVGREFETKRHPRRILTIRFSWIAQFAGEAVVIVVHDVTSLRQLETMRRDFVANVSHELKTPLSSIKAYSETLRLGAIDDPVNRLRFVERIEEQADRLSDLILDLIRLARVESGMLAFEIRDISLGLIAQQRIDAFRVQSEKRCLTLDLKVTSPTIMVRGD